MSTFPAHDGTPLDFRELGEGRPLVLLHGFSSDARMLVDAGPAPALAEAGFRVVLPDLRGHGANAAATAYPRDVLADDGLALVEHLGLDDYDLAGYSLGGRVVVRMLVRGARPARAVVGGQGLAEVTRTEQASGRSRALLTAMAAGTAFEPGSPEDEEARWMRHAGADPAHLVAVLDSLVATPVDHLAGVATPTLVVTGADDPRTTGPELAAALPAGVHRVVPGDHVSALSSPETTAVLLAFLTRPHG